MIDLLQADSGILDRLEQMLEWARHFDSVSFKGREEREDQVNRGAVKGRLAPINRVSSSSSQYY